MCKRNGRVKWSKDVGRAEWQQRMYAAVTIILPVLLPTWKKGAGAMTHAERIV